MLDDRHRGLGEIHRELESCRCVLDVVETRGSSLHLQSATDPARVGAQPVEGRLLVLVLAVFQGLSEQPGDRDLDWKAIGLAASHISRDPGVVGGRVGVGLCREATPRGRVECAFVQRSEDLRVTVWAHHHHD